jgi:hypothetical protein
MAVYKYTHTNQAPIFLCIYLFITGTQTDYYQLWEKTEEYVKINKTAI